MPWRILNWLTCAWSWQKSANRWLLPTSDAQIWLIPNYQPSTVRPSTPVTSTLHISIAGCVCMMDRYANLLSYLLVLLLFLCWLVVFSYFWFIALTILLASLTYSWLCLYLFAISICIPMMDRFFHLFMAVFCRTIKANYLCETAFCLKIVCGGRFIVQGYSLGWHCGYLCVAFR